MITNLLGLHPFVQSAIGGVMIGFASWLLLASLGRVAGITGILGGALAPFNGVAKDERAWRWAFVVGLVTMGGIAAFIVGHTYAFNATAFSFVDFGGFAGRFWHGDGLRLHQRARRLRYWYDDRLDPSCRPWFSCLRALLPSLWLSFLHKKYS